MRRRNIINKKAEKKIAQKCRICGEKTYSTLSVHRIIPGYKSGSYTRNNTTVICENCHRKVHNGLIEIDGWYKSTKGRMLKITENGQEKFI